jgi:hypothetical protein
MHDEHGYSIVLNVSRTVFIQAYTAAVGAATTVCMCCVAEAQVAITDDSSVLVINTGECSYTAHSTSTAAYT